MQVEVVKWGNSTAVRLPAAILKVVKVALGDQLELTTTEDGKIVLQPVRHEYRLDDLLAGITKANRHASVDFGAPVGREGQ
ncbi:AbrB/MazE/SpoVT family DNA-binding domain-containing protein [Aquincola sp. S2]|uniref:AbrB/MazE/SpoVT family DNA-binding domain-containing protein n=1 Tax=Pseudaquabacterium terrae TaxID=2732868 RepID=A0ABX2ERZ8_9BURK|nr:AbrB/MazE/SpoVT family DNA-binding domain-containing protein [Aquabacterium terrae]NRF71406.1 AbrB/MazE/SpoVT family DNA-binding domain-containing protein [Aquabacterium terrae]